MSDSKNLTLHHLYNLVFLKALLRACRGKEKGGEKEEGRQAMGDMGPSWTLRAFMSGELLCR